MSFITPRAKSTQDPDAAPGLIFCPPLAPCPLALPLCPPGGSPLRSLPGCALVSAEASGHTPRPGKGSAAAGQHVAAGRLGHAHSFFRDPPPPPPCFFSGPSLCRAGLSLPDGTPASQRQGFGPPFGAAPGAPRAKAWPLLAAR